MLINLKVKTLDAQTHEFEIDNEITVREFKDKVAEKTNISAENQRIIYCGRVLADEKHMKEYDVNGKVLHVAERPPFSQRGPNAPNNDEPRETRGRGRERGMRNSPLFRALDGMVVGTMAIPVGPGMDNGQGNYTNPFTASSSFCMNRITVARHMLDCANNIAAYLENPEVGLNNAPLDILQRGRWTMESTVVEVGISAAEFPRNQNLVDMVQGAVSAALARNGGSNRNLTVVQLPTVYSSDDTDTDGNTSTTSIGNASAATATVATAVNEDVQRNAGGSTDTGTGNNVAAARNDAGGASASAADTTAAAVIIEDVIDADDELLTEGTNNSTASTANANTDINSSSNAVDSGNDADTSTNTDENTERNRRTGTPVLAEVIAQMRAVQTRLDPFVTHYYDLLLNEPNFEENDTPARENAQRLYDRVSEALHYLSHAQHAISDLMLDVSQPAPRYLTCRPILVEQSGYISSNNFITAGEMRQHQRQQNNQTQRAPTARASNNASAARAARAAAQAADAAVNAARFAVNAASVAANAADASNAATNVANNAAGNDADSAAGNAADSTAGNAADNGAGNAVDNAAGNAVDNAAGNATNNTTTSNGNSVASAAAAPVPIEADPVDDPISPPPNLPRGGGGANADTIGQATDNHQMQMARLIQAVVNSAPIDTEFHVQINAPSVMSIGVPMMSNNIPLTIHNVSTTQPDTPQQQRGGARSTNVANASTTTNSSNNGTASTTPTDTANADGGSGESRASVTTATLPTTSTQTRSTSRPQSQSNNNWGGRFVPTNMINSFDRFLQCNSHHIRELENPNSNTATNGNNNRRNQPQPRPGSPTPSTASITNRFSPAYSPSTTPSRTAPSSGGASSAPTRNDRPDYRSEAEAFVEQFNSNPNANPFSELLGSLMERSTYLGSIRSPSVGARGNANSANADSSARTDNAGNNNASNNNNNNSSVIGTYVYNYNLRSQLCNFLTQNLYEGAPVNDETTSSAVNRAIDWFGESLIYLPQYEKPEYNSRDSIMNILRLTVPRIINLCNDTQENVMQFVRRLKQLCEQFMKRLYSVIFVCVGRTNAEVYWSQLMRLLQVPVQSSFRNEALQFLRVYINPTIPSSADTVDAQQFLVHRVGTSSNNTPQSTPPVLGWTTVAPATDSIGTERLISDRPAATENGIRIVAGPLVDDNDDVEMTDVAPNNELTNNHHITESAGLPSEIEIQLPAVVSGSQSWHRHFPQDWLPTITRDLQRQADHPMTQPPFSDAYISGMSAKRRKVIQSNKPSTDVETLVADSVRKAIQSAGAGVGGPAVAAAGPSSTAPNQNHSQQQQQQQQQQQSVDKIAKAIASDSAVQASYTEMVRHNVRQRIQNDSDYDPERFPQTAKFIQNHK